MLEENGNGTTNAVDVPNEDISKDDQGDDVEVNTPNENNKAMEVEGFSCEE